MQHVIMSACHMGGKILNKENSEDEVNRMNHWDQRAEWLRRATSLKPELKHWAVNAQAMIECEKSDTAWQKTTVRNVGLASSLSDMKFKTGSRVIVDFGETVVGRIRLKLRPEGKNDSPLRLQIIAAELPYEVDADFADFRGGLSRSWLQDEVVNIDVLPCVYDFPRRYSLRYLKIDVLAAAGEIIFDEISVIAESSEEFLPDSSLPLSLEEKRIDKVALRTLRNCMQDVFEDGPKRDRRLWLGDLRLQAKANRHSFRRFDVVERSLLLLAAATDDEGRVPACVYTEPTLRHGNDITDYSLLLSDVVLDLIEATDDIELGRQLFPLVCRQFELFRPNFAENGLLRDDVPGWTFIDWAEFNKSSALHGIYVYSLKAAVRLAEKVGLLVECESLQQEIQHKSESLRRLLYDESCKLIVSGPDREISYAGQVWPILAGIFSPDEAKEILSAVENVPEAVRPRTPYMYHHLVEAYFYAGMDDKASALINSYWGEMVRLGADTFWEVFEPGNDFLSPYKEALSNSACHAWSCTPICFFAEH